MTALTKRQSDCLAYLAEYRKTYPGASPAYQQIMEALGLKSKSGVHRLVLALEQRGFVRRVPHLARAVEIIRVPGDPRDAVVSAARELLAAATLYDNSSKTLAVSTSLAATLWSALAEVPA